MNGWNSLHQIMELAGLPAGTFEAVSLSVQEVNGLVNLMGRKADCAPVYDVSDVVFGVAELAQQGARRSAAVYPDIPPEGSIASRDGDRMTAAALMSGGLVQWWRSEAGTE